MNGVPSASALRDRDTPGAGLIILVLGSGSPMINNRVLDCRNTHRGHSVHETSTNQYGRLATRRAIDRHRSRSTHHDCCSTYRPSLWHLPVALAPDTSSAPWACYPPFVNGRSQQ